jgi:PadR family transcriptional regulator, regulatory protein PadR
LSSHWGDSENNRKARYYEMTAAGRKQLRAETDNWDRVALAITRALKAT